SELADGINAKLVLNRILNVPVELTAGEILGVSKELSGLLAESIKPKTVSRKDVHLAYDVHRAHEPEAGSFRASEGFEAKAKEALIELPIMINGCNLKAVIDTGSQLNIVSEDTYEKFIKLPINRS
ncbi:hypothetical protein BDR06DRAFT_866702, partial [Suillus hirtellus]